MTRQSIWDIDGFDERHNLGWHLDSNISRRLIQYFGELKTAAPYLHGWHCNHTRNATALHSADAKSNSFAEVALHVIQPYLPEQRATWGAPDYPFEELNIKAARNETILAAFDKIFAGTTPKQYDIAHMHQNYTPVFPDHLKPYVMDVLYTFARSINIGYAGYDPVQFSVFMDVWQALGFAGKIFFIGYDQTRQLHSAYLPTIATIDIEHTLEHCDLIVTDFLVTSSDAAHASEYYNQKILGIIHQLIRLEQIRLTDKKNTPRKFIGLNGSFCDLGILMKRYTNAQTGSLSSRVIHGTVIATQKSA
jgi:hypothetical protein